MRRYLLAGSRGTRLQCWGVHGAPPAARRTVTAARRSAFGRAGPTTLRRGRAGAAFALRWTSLRRLALRAGGDHGQRRPAALGVDVQYPDRHHVADRHYLVRTLDVAVGHLADVHQAAVLQADVHERPERHDVEYGALQFH